MTAVATDPDFEALLAFLKWSRAFDFTGYKRTTLRRLVDRRMAAVGVSTYADYNAMLEAQPEEFTELFDTLLINVTGFFRDREAWSSLDQKVLPHIVEASDGGPIRCWTAGCASGEEAYTVAILLAERMGLVDFCERVKIYATDVDERALAEARAATYSPKQLEAVPDGLVERYFEPAGGGHQMIRKDMRRCVIFGRHDLIQNAPISRISLLTCRNALMYFTSETQSQILRRFHFALSDDGVLFLGKAEMLVTHGDIFSPLDLKNRIFRRVARPGGALRVPSVGIGHPEDRSGKAPTADELGALMVDRGLEPQIVIDRTGDLRLANAAAMRFFGLRPDAVGKAFRDLELSFRPMELRGPIQQVQEEAREIELGTTEWSMSGQPVFVDVSLVPLSLDGGPVMGVLASFRDVTKFTALQRELEDAQHELEVAYEELQSTNEELETTNEELQSTVEELETTNEELQSTNEELETMNEEVQSANDELQTINDELRVRTAELNELNAFLESVLTGLRGAVVVVDTQQRVRVWNTEASELWGLRSDEVDGEHFLNLDIGLPVEHVLPLLRRTLAGEEVEPAVLAATDRRGRAVDCGLTITPLRSSDGDLRGAILIMERADGAPAGEPTE